MTNADFTPPVVETRGATDPATPLVILLHGRGSDEHGMTALSSKLPDSLAYAAVRAPIQEGSGYAWFANRGIGRPVASSLRSTMDWFGRWLDEAVPVERQVVLVGFSGGAAFAGGLVLDNPARYSGAAILYGTIPFDAGVPMEPGRLGGVDVLIAQGDSDQVIPRELLAATWSYLVDDSGAAVTTFRDGGGHGISSGALEELRRWLQELRSGSPQARESVTD